LHGSRSRPLFCVHEFHCLKFFHASQFSVGIRTIVGSAMRNQQLRELTDALPAAQDEILDSGARSRNGVNTLPIPNVNRFTHSDRKPLKN
jgi:hypothetical protein